jgi:hypothetical protein
MATRGAAQAQQAATGIQAGNRIARILQDDWTIRAAV